ncbi:flagellar assembly protein FliW [Chitinimonas koreensis]|uniref:flagellar assembly protein FliW n=1 Tax=Chitinimonas koreensis TaxID=356302 RepID=UPI000427F4B5|nr:flagellar assembly protein FliW [Chitinimonas koreensis]QNM95611.1 flagellar assembly protein FliW [Chitinimonas koreensis]
MQVVTPRFGTLDVDEQSLIVFPDGLPGFERCQRFKLLHEDVAEPKVLWMQSLDDAEVVFSVIDAQLLGLNYQLTLSDAECEKIGFSGDDGLVMLLTLTRGGDGIQANTRSPIVLNARSRLAIQKGGVRAEIVFTNE